MSQRLVFSALISIFVSMPFAQTPVTVGSVNLTLPVGWDSLFRLSPTQMMVDYSPGGRGAGNGMLYENPDSNSSAADSMGRIFAQAMAGSDRQYVDEGDSAWAGSGGKMSWAQFSYIDTTSTPLDTAHGRFYFAHNGSTGIAFLVFPDSLSFAAGMYNDVTNMLINWAATSIRTERVLRAQRSYRPWLVDLRGRKYPRIPGRLPSDAVGILVPIQR